MLWKNLRCLLPVPDRQNPSLSKICGKHLGDVEACTDTTVRFTCTQKHAKGCTDRIEFHQDVRGVLSWREVPLDKNGKEKKQYEDDGVRIAAVTADDMP
jgi:hypothetical protein